MAVVEWTAQAEEDLIDIWVYISQDNPAAADELLDEIDRKCALLAANPYMGPARPDIAPELRYFPVGLHQKQHKHRLLKSSVPPRDVGRTWSTVNMCPV